MIHKIPFLTSLLDCYGDLTHVHPWIWKARQSSLSPTLSPPTDPPTSTWSVWLSCGPQSEVKHEWGARWAWGSGSRAGGRPRTGRGCDCGECSNSRTGRCPSSAGQRSISERGAHMDEGHITRRALHTTAHHRKSRLQPHSTCVSVAGCVTAVCVGVVGERCQGREG